VSSTNRGMTPISRLTLRLQSDSRLVELAAGGRGMAFEAIVERYRSPLMRYCTRLLTHDHAEDVVQQTFVNALSALNGDERPRELRPWLYRIAHNLAVNSLLKNGSEYEQLSEDYDGVPQPPDIVERRWRLRALVQSIRDLPERQRSALVLREFEGRSYEEIARELEATPPIVRQLLHRARSRVRDSVGLLIPLPVIRALLAHAPQGGPGPDRLAEVATGAAATGGVAKVGASMLAAATIAAGAGVAVQSKTDRAHRQSNEARAAQPKSSGSGAASSGQLAAVADSGSSSASPAKATHEDSNSGSPSPGGDKRESNGDHNGGQGGEPKHQRGSHEGNDHETSPGDHQEDPAEPKAPDESGDAEASDDHSGKAPTGTHEGDGSGGGGSGKDHPEAPEPDPQPPPTPE
jgi:RNA polymerase sigma factor (sigma-70 family)